MHILVISFHVDGCGTFLDQKIREYIPLLNQENIDILLGLNADMNNTKTHLSIIVLRSSFKCVFLIPFLKQHFRNGSWEPWIHKEKNHNTKTLTAFSEIGKQHLLMFYFPLVKIYIIYITWTEEPHSLSQRKLKERHIWRQVFSYSFQLNQHLGHGDWQ